jgi:uncharacterized cupin superfamily protein
MPDDAISQAVHTIAFDPNAQPDAGARSTTKLWYSDPDGAFRTGFWAAQPGKAAIAYTKDELCMLLEGEVRLTAADGIVATYRAGDTFIIPKGFTGTWETVSPVRKFFATYTKA